MSAAFSHELSGKFSQKLSRQLKQKIRLITNIKSFS
jgi:hypothetical protein